jgi:hypothetical protein
MQGTHRAPSSDSADRRTELAADRTVLAAERTYAAWAAHGVSDRCEIVGGNMFGSLPRGGDGYLFKNVLLDEENERVCAILRACRSAPLDQWAQDLRMWRQNGLTLISLPVGIDPAVQRRANHTGRAR